MGEIDMALVAEHRADERVLSEHMEEFVRVGLALARIRERRSYKLVDGFKTFEDYCKEKWNISDRHGRRLIEAAEIRQLIPNLPDVAVKNGPAGSDCWTERHMRELGRLKSEGKARRVADRVVKDVKQARVKGEKVKLGSIVRKHVDQELGAPGKKTPKADDSPTFKDVMFRWCGRLDAMSDTMGNLNDDAVQRFCEAAPLTVERFAEAVDRVKKALERFQAAIA